MENEYKKLVTLPNDEKVIAMTTIGGTNHWSFKFPFRFYKRNKVLLLTEKAIYEVEINAKNK